MCRFLRCGEGIDPAGPQICLPLSTLPASVGVWVQVFLFYFTHRFLITSQWPPLGFSSSSVAPVTNVRESCRMMARELGTTWDSQPQAGAVWPRHSAGSPSPGIGHLPEHQEGPRLGVGGGSGDHQQRPTAWGDWHRFWVMAGWGCSQGTGQGQGGPWYPQPQQSTAKLCYHTRRPPVTCWFSHSFSLSRSVWFFPVMGMVRFLHENQFSHQEQSRFRLSGEADLLEEKITVYFLSLTSETVQ